MKKLSCAFYFIFLSTFASAQNPVPNRGLENWNGTPLNPVSWYSNTNANNITITRVNGNTGYGAQGNVIHSVTNTRLSPYLGCNFPVSQIYENILFYYKANLDSNDVLQVSAAIYDSANTFLASNYFNIVFSSSSFIPFTLSLTPASGGIPDHALITFTIIPQSPDSVHLDSYFIIDDVELYSGPLGISEENEHNEISVFPNPVKEILQIKLSEFNNARLTLLNSSGKIIIQKNLSSSFNDKFEDYLDLEYVDPGIYFLKIEMDEGVGTRKIIVA